jgi:hypothetical protein
MHATSVDLKRNGRPARWFHIDPTVIVSEVLRDIGNSPDV